jgi:hypothetical protein
MTDKIKNLNKLQEQTWTLLARVGWSDLGWAMENLWAVSMGRQFFCMSTVGPPNKKTCMYTSKNKDTNNKSKQNYPNYQMQMMLLSIEASTLFIQQQRQKLSF